MRSLSSLLLILATVPAFAQEGKTGFLERVFKDANGEAKYMAYVPPSYKGDQAFPLILFLHGSGETGTDGVKQATVGLGKAIKEKKAFPFIVLFPQSHDRTWKADSNDGKRAMAILAEAEKTWKIDSKRIYLTGLSMGGFGTWSLAAAHPERWAAIAPVCGGGNPADAAKIKSIPVWCFHGDADKAVKVERSRDMIKALKDVGAEPKYDEYPGVGHNSWDRAYATKELYKWMLSHQSK